MLQEAKGRKIVLEHCATLTQGLQALSKDDFNILLLDLTLPDSIGFETFVKVYTQYPKIPIIVLTGTNDEELAIKSVRTGAQDYLIKGQIDSSLLSRSISYAIERAGLLRVVQQELIERKRAEEALQEATKEREKLIQELQYAIENIKTLQGLLPICSNCKKIRDDQGFWNQVEGYIMAHSDAQFTHGICPECSKLLYGDLYEKALEKQNKKNM